MIGWKPPERVTGFALYADHDARMLNRLVRKKQSRPDCADFRSLGMLEHRREPVRRNHFCVVVEKKQVIATGECCRDVVHPSEIEWLGILDHPVRQVTQVVERFRILALVVDDENFEMAVGGLVFETLDAALQQTPIVSSWNNDADNRLARYLPIESVVIRTTVFIDIFVNNSW